MPIRTSTPSADLSRCTYLVWGTVKCGKTTFAAGFPGAVFIATEDGMKGVRASRWEAEDGHYVVQSWQEILNATQELIGATPRPSMIVLDTIDNAYFLLEQYICKKHNVEYKNDDDLAFGKGTALINAELRRYLLKLSSIGVGIILTSHTAPAERDTKKGHVTIENPSIPDKVRPMILGMVDFIFYCTTDTYKKSADAEPETRHVMYTRPAPTHIAGHRIGKLPEVLPLSYEVFAEKFAEGTNPGTSSGAGAGSTTTTQRRAREEKKSQGGTGETGGTAATAAKPATPPAAAANAAATNASAAPAAPPATATANPTTDPAPPSNGTAT